MNSPVIPQRIFKMLHNLKANNNREWFLEHKPEYIALQEEFKKYGEVLQAELQKFDTFSRVKVYRIYRDVRFSKDKTPYHTYRGISYFRTGKGEYYLNIEPNNSFIVAGYWAIATDELKRLRGEFEYDTSEIKEILSEPTFNKHYKKLEPFELKTAPRGFDKNHPNIDFIRKKSLLVKKTFTEKEVLSPNFLASILEAYKVAQPLLHYIDAVLSTDINGVPLGE